MIRRKYGCNYIESLLGIETAWPYKQYWGNCPSCNYIESLLGIETLFSIDQKLEAIAQTIVATILNPY